MSIWQGYFVAVDMSSNDMNVLSQSRLHNVDILGGTHGCYRTARVAKS